MTKLPAILDDATGLSRNVSATGVFFEAHAPCEVCSRISFTVDLKTGANDQYGAPVHVVLKCKGDIVRTEARFPHWRCGGNNGITNGSCGIDRQSLRA